MNPTDPSQFFEIHLQILKLLMHRALVQKHNRMWLLSGKNLSMNFCGPYKSATVQSLPNRRNYEKLISFSTQNPETLFPSTKCK